VISIDCPRRPQTRDRVLGRVERARVRPVDTGGRCVDAETVSRRQPWKRNRWL